jgi:imidazolonepropionase
MREILISNIRELLLTNESGRSCVAGKEMQEAGIVQNAWLLIRDDRIAAYGNMDALPSEFTAVNNMIDASDRIVMPSFCDPHTHLVYAGSREKEFVDKIRGLSYEEIARRGGGILNSASLLANTSEDDLYEQSLQRAEEILRMGTAAVEIKSGYGLSTENELKMLRVIRRISEKTPLMVRATFLGAHAVPEAYRDRRSDYVDLIINEMIPNVAYEGLADYIDVFCDKGFFSTDDTERILMAGMKYGLKPKIHANELDYSGGIQTGVKYAALSVDHLEYTGEEEIRVLLDSGTMPTILPGASFFLGLPYAPARRMIDAGLPVAFASDYNPGSSPSGNMRLVLSMACIKYKLIPAEALHAVTLNAAFAMGVDDEAGSITVGKKANLIISRIVPGHEFLPYAFGTDWIEKHIVSGQIVR